ncbi:MAG: hypothetical protein K8R73_10510 [Clostridiales bacterium]|nr:hypothetical protein [Clostridiales bacterium]
MKSRLSILMIICLLMTTLIGGNSYAEFDSYKPIIGLVPGADTQVVNAGEKSTYTVQMKNVSSMAARMIRVTLKGDHPFRSDITTLSKTVTYLNPNNTAEAIFDVEVSPTADSRIYEFDVVFDYYNYYDQTYSSTEKAYVKVVNNNIEPIIGLMGTTNTDNTIKPDQPNAVVLNLKNTGTISAKDMRISVSGFSNQGVILYNDADTKSLQELRAGSTELVYFNIISGKDVGTGTFPLSVNVSYIDDFGGSYTKDFTVYLNLAGAEDIEAELHIDELKIPDQIWVNKDFNVTFDVLNTGQSTLENVEVNYNYPQEFIAKSNSKVILKGLAPGERRTVTFKMMAKSETVTESYHSYIETSYYAVGQSPEDKQSTSEYVGIYVLGKSDGESGGASKPKLIVERYDYGDDYVYAGQDFTLDLWIKNTSSVAGTRNIKVTLSSEENVFTPVDSSSSFFVSNIGPNQVAKHTISLKTKIDANVKIYALTTKMEYEDSSGNAYDQNNNPFEETEVLSVAVAQPVRLETSELVLPFEIYSGQPFYIEQEFYNMGKSTMYNMMVKLEGVQTNEGSYFVGNFEAGSSDYFSAQIFAQEMGLFEGKLVYSFEDALGNISTVEKDFSYSVIEAPVFDGEFPGGPIDPGMPIEEPSNNGWVKYAIGAAILFAIVFFFILRSRKKKRLAKELEALDE